jgi:hypothetical protein
MPMKEISPASVQNTKGKNVSVCGEGKLKKKPFFGSVFFWHVKTDIGVTLHITKGTWLIFLRS